MQSRYHVVESSLVPRWHGLFAGKTRRSVYTRATNGRHVKTSFTSHRGRAMHVHVLFFEPSNTSRGIITVLNTTYKSAQNKCACTRRKDADVVARVVKKSQVMSLLLLARQRTYVRSWVVCKHTCVCIESYGRWEESRWNNNDPHNTDTNVRDIAVRFEN